MRFRQRRIFGKITRKKLNHETSLSKSKELAKGEENVADIAKCYEYMEDPKNREKLEKAFAYLSEFAKTSSYIKRRNVLAVKYFNFAVQYLAMCAIIKRAPRTGVLEHFTKNEFNAAKLYQGKRIILVANHKMAALGPAELVQ